MGELGFKGDFSSRGVIVQECTQHDCSTGCATKEVRHLKFADEKTFGRTITAKKDNFFPFFYHIVDLFLILGMKEDRQ